MGYGASLQPQGGFLLEQEGLCSVPFRNRLERDHRPRHLTHALVPLLLNGTPFLWKGGENLAMDALRLLLVTQTIQGTGVSRITLAINGGGTKANTLQINTIQWETVQHSVTLQRQS